MMILAAWTLTFFFRHDGQLVRATVDEIPTARYCRTLGLGNEQPGIRWRCDRASR